MNISDYLRTALLNHSLSVSSFTMPTRVYAALYTTAPSSAGGGVEVSAGDYARVQTHWSAAAVGVIENSGDIRFPIVGTTLSNWGTASHLGLFDSLTSGNLLFFGPLSAPVTLNVGDDFKVAANSLTITLG